MVQFLIQQPNQSKQVTICIFSLTICLRILSLQHPDIEGLYVETVDIGTGTSRIAVSKLASSVPMTNLQGRLGVFLCNLKPSKMKSVDTTALHLCAVK